MANIQNQRGEEVKVGRPHNLNFLCPRSAHLSSHHAVWDLRVVLPAPLLCPLCPAALWGRVRGGLRLPSGLLLQPADTHLCAQVRLRRWGLHQPPFTERSKAEMSDTSSDKLV